MSDKNSSPRYPSVEQLRAIVPDTWTLPHDLTRATRTIETDLTKVRVRKSYLGIPRPIWNEFGKPAMVVPFLVGWDLLLVHGAGLKITPRQNFVRVPFHIYTRWHTMLVPGMYEYRIEQDPKSGVTALRVRDCNHMCIDKRHREQWIADAKEQRACKRSSTR